MPLDINDPATRARIEAKLNGGAPPIAEPPTVTPPVAPPVAPPAPTPDLPPDVPVDVPTVRTPTSGLPPTTHTVDFAKVQAKHGDDVKTFGDLLGARVAGRIVPWSALGGAGALVDEAHVKNNCFPVDASHTADAKQSFAVGMGNPEFKTAGMGSPEFHLMVGCYNPETGATLDPAELLQLANTEPARVPEYVQNHIRTVLNHENWGSHVASVQGQNGKVISNSAPASYFGNGRFSGGAYHSYPILDIGIPGLSPKKQWAANLSMSVLDHLTAGVSDVTGFDGNYEGGMGLKNHRDVLAFSGLTYLAIVMKDDGAIRELNGNKKWQHFCAERGAAVVNCAGWAPPTIEGITRALETLEAETGYQSPHDARDIYKTLWRGMNDGTLTKFNGNPASEQFRYKQLTNADIRPIDRELGVDAASMPSGGLAFPIMTPSGYVESTLDRLYPMDYSRPPAEQAQGAAVRKIIWQAMVPDIIKRAGLDDPTVAHLKDEFMAAADFVMNNQVFGSREEATAALAPYYDKMDDAILAVPGENDLPPFQDPEQGMALPPGALIQAAIWEKQAGRNRGWADVEVGRIGFRNDVF